MADEPCSICGGSFDEHEEMNHEFNLNNQLIAKDRSTPKRPAQRMPTVIGAYDLELRQVLLAKGIITNEDFTALRHPGTRPPGDREAGEAEGS